MRRGTQGHVAAPRGPAQRGDVAHIYIVYSIILINIKCSLSSPYKGGSYPYLRSGIIYPTVSINKTCVGLKLSLTYLTGYVARRQASDRAVDRTTSVDRVDSWITGFNQKHVLNRRVMTVGSDATWQHLRRRSRGSWAHRRSINTCVNRSVITAEINRRGLNLSRWIEIEWGKI